MIHFTVPLLRLIGTTHEKMATQSHQYYERLSSLPWICIVTLLCTVAVSEAKHPEKIVAFFQGKNSFAVDDGMNNTAILTRLKLALVRINSPKGPAHHVCVLQCIATCMHRCKLMCIVRSNGSRT